MVTVPKYFSAAAAASIAVVQVFSEVSQVHLGTSSSNCENGVVMSFASKYGESYTVTATSGGTSSTIIVAYSVSQPKLF